MYDIKLNNMVVCERLLYLKVLHLEKLRKWKRDMKIKGLRVDASNTKIMRCQVIKGQFEDSREHAGM